MSPREVRMVSGAKPETGHYEEFMAHPAFFLLRAYRECGEVAGFDLAGQRNILLTGPEAQEAVFRAPDPMVLSAAAAYQYMVPVFGQGIQYGATFEMERQQTKLMATAMRAGRMKSYADIIAKEVEEWIADWGDSGEIDVLEVFQALVLRTSTHSLMGSDFRKKLTDEFGALYHELESAVAPEAMLDPYGSGEVLKRRDRARARLQELVLAEVAERKRSGRQYADMIDTFMTATLDDGSKLPEHLIPGMVVWIMFGGFHTSSNTSAWTLLEYARNRQYMAELMAEVDGIYQSGGDLSYASLREIPLLEGFIFETLRLHPPLCVLARQVMQPFSFEDYTFRVGDTVVCSPYAAHRVAEVYPDPERFDPHRKLPDNPFAYIPFGAGMRKCVGNAFGILQVKSVMCAMLSRYDFELVGPPEDVQDVMPSLILRPTEGGEGPISTAGPLGETGEVGRNARTFAARECRRGVTSRGFVMKIKIDLQLCQGHGVCVEEAPEVFRVVSEPGRYDHAELIVAEPDESLRAAVEAAVRYCPNKSLKLEG